MYALIQLDEHKQGKQQIEKKQAKERRKDWSEKLGEVNISDAREKDEDLSERARKSPDILKDEKIAQNARVMRWDDGATQKMSGKDD